MNEDFADYLVKKTQKDYNLVAQSFASSRHFTWDIKPLRNFVSKGDRVLDVGCGNGRLLDVLEDKQVNYIGIDFSRALLEIAKKNYPSQKFIFGDVLKFWPFPGNYFDEVFALRFLHHLPSKEKRLNFLYKVKKTLKPGGLLLLTVWEKHLGNKKEKSVLSEFTKQIPRKFFDKATLDFGDAFIPWNRKTLRYYHFFSLEELNNLVKEVGFQVTFLQFNKDNRKYSDIYLKAKKSSH